MRLPILIAFMLMTGIAVAVLSAMAGIGAVGIVLRIIAALVLVQAIYFAALLFAGWSSRRPAKTPKDAPAALKHRSPR